MKKLNKVKFFRNKNKKKNTKRCTICFYLETLLKSFEMFIQDHLHDLNTEVYTRTYHSLRITRSISSSLVRTKLYPWRERSPKTSAILIRLPVLLP